MRVGYAVVNLDTVEPVSTGVEPAAKVTAEVEEA